MMMKKADPTDPIMVAIKTVNRHNPSKKAIEQTYAKSQKKVDWAMYKQIGETIRYQREQKNMSLQDLSERIGKAKSKQTLMRYENGQLRIPTDVFEKVCDVLELNMSDVVEEAKNFQYVAFDVPKKSRRKVPYAFRDIDGSEIHLSEEEMNLVSKYARQLISERKEE